MTTEKKNKKGAKGETNKKPTQPLFYLELDFSPILLFGGEGKGKPKASPRTKNHNIYVPTHPNILLVIEK